MFIKINGKTHYLWRAVDQHGNVLDILVTARRDATAASRFFRKLLNILQGAVALCEVGAGETVDFGWLDRPGQLVEGSQDP